MVIKLLSRSAGVVFATVILLTIGACSKSQKPQAEVIKAPVIPEAEFIANKGYKLVWHDEFDKLSLAPGRNEEGFNWWPGMWYFKNEDKTASDQMKGLNERVTLKDGYIHMTHYSLIATMSHDGQKGKWWKFGYFEARLRMDDENPNCFAAWWLFSRQHAMTTDGNPPKWSELDIFEHFADKKGVFVGTTHDWNNFKNTQNNNNWQPLPEGTDLSQWHTYGLLWEPGLLIWTFDGKEVMRFNSYPINDEQECYAILEGKIHEDKYKEKGGPSDSYTDVDWVRVWQKP